MVRFVAGVTRFTRCINFLKVPLNGDWATFYRVAAQTGPRPRPRAPLFFWRRLIPLSSLLHSSNWLFNHRSHLLLSPRERQRSVSCFVTFTPLYRPLLRRSLPNAGPFKLFRSLVIQLRAKSSSTREDILVGKAPAKHVVSARSPTIRFRDTTARHRSPS